MNTFMFPLLISVDQSSEWKVEGALAEVTVGLLELSKLDIVDGST